MAVETLDGGSPPREEETVAAAAEEAKEEEEEEEVKGEEEEAKGEEEGEKGEDESSEVKLKKKRGRPKKEGRGGGEAEKLKTPEKKVRKRRSTAGEQATPVDRPSRERKTVERYSALSPQKVSASKSVEIKQGTGTKLKDIPNVVFKISKRKADESLQNLHTILFGKRAKALYMKRNIFQFSGFVWTDNEEKQRAKVKEKLEKCVKDKLLDFCDLLDISVSRATTKKEELAAKLLEFLESPYVTRDLVLAEKEQSGKKRRRRSKGASETISGEKQKRRKRSPKAEDDEQNEESEEADSADDKDDASEKQDSEQERAQEKSDTEGEENDPEEPVGSKKASAEKQMKKENRSKVKVEVKPVKKNSSAKSIKTSPRSSKKSVSAPDDEPKEQIKSKQSTSKEKTMRASKGSAVVKSSPVKTSSARKSDPEVNIDSGSAVGPKYKNNKKGQKNKDSSTPVKGSKKPASTQKEGKGKAKAAVTPTREEMHAVVSDILREVDFNTATLADILRQLGAHFNKDLMDRKAEVKRIIEDVINNMTDDEGDEDEDGDAEEAAGLEGGQEGKEEATAAAEESEGGDE